MGEIVNKKYRNKMKKKSPKKNWMCKKIVNGKNPKTFT